MYIIGHGLILILLAARIPDLDAGADWQAIRANILFVSLVRNASRLAPAAPSSAFPRGRCTALGRTI